MQRRTRCEDFWNQESSNSVLFQGCFGLLGSVEEPDQCEDHLLHFYKKDCWNFSWEYTDSVDGFEWCWCNSNIVSSFLATRNVFLFISAVRGSFQRPAWVLAGFTAGYFILQTLLRCRDLPNFTFSLLLARVRNCCWFVHVGLTTCSFAESLY